MAGTIPTPSRLNDLWMESIYAFNDELQCCSSPLNFGYWMMVIGKASVRVVDLNELNLESDSSGV